MGRQVQFGRDLPKEQAFENPYVEPDLDTNVSDPHIPSSVLLFPI